MSLSSLFGGVSQAQKLSALENASPLGVYLSKEELTALARLCTSCKVKPGKNLPESPFYIVIKGEVEVREAAERWHGRGMGEWA